MGLTETEICKLSLPEFTLRLHGYAKRKEEQWDHTRHIMGTIINFAGWGTKDYLPVERVMGLARDTEDEIKPIRTREKALELLERLSY